MKKKFIGLSILLLVLLLGLFTECFVLSIRDYTVYETMMDNVFDNYPNNGNGSFEDRYTTLINSNVWNNYKTQIPFSSYNSCVIRMVQIDTNTMGIEIFLYSNNYDLNVASNGVVTSSNLIVG